MGPRAYQVLSRTPRFRSRYQDSQFCLLHPSPRSRPQTPVIARHYSHSQYNGQPLPPSSQVGSSLGKGYIIDEVLYERPAAGRVWRVYRAKHEEKQFILKDILPGDFQYILDLQKHVQHSPHVRTSVESIPERRMLVFPYLEKRLLYVDTTVLPPAARKAIIRDALVGLAHLHDKNIIHTDIKPTNIMMDSFKLQNGELGWSNFQITDLESAVLLPLNVEGLTDRLSGNHFWRSPEAWARGVQNTPSDVYSFAIVTRT
ncbi:kinase-like domain-containing protein [Rhypophila decipiens]|uniref:Kinase-like domain-containing protein n=1 Tax=Rhypophila decipiens TaxID=261697 RepID=A0AAN6XUH1_9PEZI|nr:kinase-like domain-containing protein [Rhypophila decipiens]